MGYNLYLGILISSAVISFALAIFFWTRHPAPGARAMSALVAAIFTISAGYIFEVSTTTVEGYRIANDIEYVGLVTGSWK